MQAATCLLHAITNGMRLDGVLAELVAETPQGPGISLSAHCCAVIYVNEKSAFAPSWFRRDGPGLNLQRSRSAHVPPSCGLDETRRLARSLQTCRLNPVRALEHWDRSVGGACLCLSQRFFQIPCPSLHAPGLRSFPDPIRTVFPA